METSRASTFPELTDRDLHAIRELVYEQSGIALHEGKRALVTARLQKLVRAGGFHSFRDYIRSVRADRSGDELTLLLDAICTNHTSFFREPQHFAYLRDVVLPSITTGGRGVVRAWSAACATGEEPYSIAMTLFDRLGEEAAQRVRLFATDLSTKALRIARAGIYKLARVTEVPRGMGLRYFERDVTVPAGSLRVVTRLRQAVDFEHRNLLAPPQPRPPFDVIFCRNVMIYFDREAQQRVVQRLERQLAPGGFLFVSHSESLNGVVHGLTWVAPAVYQRRRR